MGNPSRRGWMRARSRWREGERKRGMMKRKVVIYNHPDALHKGTHSISMLLEILGFLKRGFDSVVLDEVREQHSWVRDHIYKRTEGREREEGRKRGRGVLERKENGSLMVELSERTNLKRSILGPRLRPKDRMNLPLPAMM